jgi:hypothetical protein
MSEIFTTDTATPISLNDALRGIKKCQAQKKAIGDTEDNLKKVVKTYMKEKGLKKYESPDGTKAQFIESQRPKWDKSAILELTGEDFGLCVEYTTSISFKVS